MNGRNRWDKNESLVIVAIRTNRTALEKSFDSFSSTFYNKYSSSGNSYSMDNELSPCAILLAKALQASSPQGSR